MDKALPRKTVEYLDTGAPEGQRNAALFDAACQMRDAGFSASEAASTLTARAVRDGLGEREAGATISSAWQSPAREPIRRGYKIRGKPWRDSTNERPMLSALQETRSVKYELATSFDWKLPEPVADGTRELLKAAFKPGEKIELVMARNGEDGKEIPDGKGPTLPLENWMGRLDKSAGNPNAFLNSSDRNGIYICINPLNGERRDDQVSAFRHVLVEFDTIPLEHQWQLLHKSNLPITAIVSSGGRSIHAWVKVDAKDRKEYDTRVKAIFEHFSDYQIDPQNKNPSRLCRLANCVRGAGRQELLALKIGAPSFEDWALSLELEDLGQQIGIDDLIAFDEENDPDCLLGKRWVCRGGSVLWIGQAGAGKSSMLMQSAILWALGRPAFGVTPARALKSVIVQAENDKGDLAEMFKGVAGGLGILGDPDALALLRQNLILVRDTVHTGQDFARVCERLIGKHKPDLMWGDPLLSYMGDDISSQKVCSEFLRHWLNPIGEKTRVAWMFLHHTGKPSQDPNARRQWTSGDKSYLGIGSSELVNWARAVVTLTQIEEGVFELGFQKRGKRAGATKGNGEATTKVILRHADKGIRWENFDDYVPAQRGRLKREGGQKKPGRDWKAIAGVLTDWTKHEAAFEKLAVALGVKAITFRTNKEYMKELAPFLEYSDGQYRAKPDSAPAQAQAATATQATVVSAEPAPLPKEDEPF
jgi:RecA-family ATPase